MTTKKPQANIYVHSRLDIRWTERNRLAAIKALIKAAAPYSSIGDFTSTTTHNVDPVTVATLILCFTQATKAEAIALWASALNYRAVIPYWERDQIFGRQ